MDKDITMQIKNGETILWSNNILSDDMIKNIDQDLLNTIKQLKYEIQNTQNILKETENELDYTIKSNVKMESDHKMKVENLENDICQLKSTIKKERKIKNEIETTNSEIIDDANKIIEDNNILLQNTKKKLNLEKKMKNDLANDNLKLNQENKVLSENLKNNDDLKKKLNREIILRVNLENQVQQLSELNNNLEQFEKKYNSCSNKLIEKETLLINLEDEILALKNCEEELEKKKKIIKCLEDHNDQVNNQYIMKISNLESNNSALEQKISILEKEKNLYESKNVKLNKYITDLKNPKYTNYADDNSISKTKILCLNRNFEEVYIPIDRLKTGDIVKTYLHGYRKITNIKKDIVIPDKWYTCVYKISKSKNKDLVDDLYLNGAHSLLVDNLGKYLDKVNNTMGIVQIDKKYLLLCSFMDEFIPHKLKKYTYYHLSICNNDDNSNRFGIWVNGILTEPNGLISF